jgi:hypothetical protein
VRAFLHRERHGAADPKPTNRPLPAAWPRAALALGVLCLGACDENDVTGVGRELVAGGVVRTVEVVLDAQDFLLSDTTLGGYSSLSAAATRLIALDAANAFQARAALQFASAPFSIDVPTDSTTVVQDTLAVFVGARLQLVLDSLSRAPGDSARLVLEAIGEAWDPATATWDNSVDSAFVESAWSVPGGGAPTPVDSAVWTAGGDTVSLFVDSATAHAWTDTDDPTRGALVRTLDEGARLEIVSAVLWLLARPSVLPDTILEVAIGTTGQISLIDAPEAPPELLLIGGAPAHRSFFRFAPGVDTLPVPCPDASVECDLTVADADLTFAGLELTPVPLAGAPAILRSPTLTARSVTADPQFPLERAPLGASSGTTALAADSLNGGVADSAFVMDVTRFLDEFLAGEDATPDRIAVASLAEGFRFGTVAVARAGSADGPRLRLILTVASPQEIR